MRLVIAEKRSVAFAIAQALGDVRQGDGYVSAGETLISWAQGHLVELSDPEEYTDMPWSARKWTMESLPIDPKSWRWRLSGAKGAVQRYRSLSELLRSDKVTELVNACDPDREGEAIFRRILMASKVSKPSLRLWVASLDEQAIRDAWKRMRPESDYDGLADAADARAKADWLVGMNASRAHTLAWHRSLSLGRVRTPTLNMVVQRDLAIESHKPTPFWRLIVPMDGWTLESGKIEDRASADRVLADAKGLAVDVLEVKRRREHAKPPTLFDLTGLQKAMSDRHGLTAEQTLDCLQHLYEMKVATYPRTDSKYVTHDDVDGLKELLQPKYALGFLDQKPVDAIHDLYSAGGFDPMRCVADDKVQGHTAILPTRRLTYDVFQHDLTDMERKVMTVILTRMWAACATDRVHDTVKVDAALDERHADGSTERVPLSASNDVTVDAGWTAIEHTSKTDGAEKKPANRIPDSLGKGPLSQSGSPSLAEGVSAPPKPFTDNTLLWRKAWADYTNDFLERNGSPERIDHRSNAERGIDEIPTVHMGVAACQMEKKGIATEKGELNRNIQKANRLIREIRAQIGKLKEWIADLFKAWETAPEQPQQSPGLANLLMKYLSVQREKSRKYSQRWQQQHTADELKTIAAAVNYLTEHGISTLDELDAALSSVSEQADTIRAGMKTAEERMKKLQKLIEYGKNYTEYKPVHDELKKLQNGWTNKRDKYEEAHRAELTLWNAASRYLHANLPKGTKTLPIAEWEQEYADLKTQRDSDYAKLKDTRADVSELQKIRKCVDIALRADQPEQTQTRTKRHDIDR